MDENMSSLSEWLSERPKWLQMAAARLLENNTLSDADIAELATACLGEASGKPPTATCVIPTFPFQQNRTESLKLCSISEIEGINQLAPRNPLEFGHSSGNLAVIYGYNGSGKSGYVRLLKHACAARTPGCLHGNVYQQSDVQQKALISYEQNGNLKNLTWGTQDGACNDLCGVDIFDSASGGIFITNENEVTYEPPELSFFTDLIDACARISEHLNQEKQRNQSKKPNFPPALQSTPEGKWYGAIDHSTSDTAIDGRCRITQDEERSIQKLQDRLFEADPQKKFTALTKQAEHIDELIGIAQKHIEQLSTKKGQEILAAIENWNVKKKAAETASQEFFAGAHLAGIGSEIWQELWRAARKYSEIVAYKNIPFPNLSDDARCVLCHQALTEEAKNRLDSFESFVTGEMQREKLIADIQYQDMLNAIEDISDPVFIQSKIDAAGISDEKLSEQILRFFTQLQQTREQFVKIKFDKDIPADFQLPERIQKGQALSRGIKEQAEQFKKDAEVDNRQELQTQLDRLKAKQWLAENKNSAVEEANLKKRLNQIQEAIKSTNPQALSKKKGSLAEALLTEAFARRFNDELANLGASQVNVEISKSKVARGKVLHKIQLKNATKCAPADVLSEGESRIVSIAAFLADVAHKDNPAPFIFDDPISSLDQNYEEAVVKRLLDLSQERQVIVFTHRLSLLGTLRHFAKNRSVEPHIVYIRATEWGTGQPAPMPLSQKTIGRALNTLMNERHAVARKAAQNNEFDRAESESKAICTDFRIILERTIEEDLLCGVIQRFQRPVETLKLKQLSKLKASDCILLNDLMTKYSKFEHSQSKETPISLPEHEELLEDMKRLRTWREEYKNRDV